MTRLCEEASGLVYWYGLTNNHRVRFIGKYDMGDTKESFDAVWNKKIWPLSEKYIVFLREDQAEDLIYELESALGVRLKNNEI